MAAPSLDDYPLTFQCDGRDFAGLLWSTKQTLYRLVAAKARSMHLPPRASRALCDCLWQVCEPKLLGLTTLSLGPCDIKDMNTIATLHDGDHSDIHGVPDYSIPLAGEMYKYTLYRVSINANNTPVTTYVKIFKGFHRQPRQHK